MLGTRDLGAGWYTREVIIHFWIVSRSLQLEMREFHNWNKLGFKWSSDSQLSLPIARNEPLSDILDFKQQWGHCGVPQKYADTAKLGGWARHQRSQYRLLKSGKKSLISFEMISWLEKLGFQWNFVTQLTLNRACNKQISELMQFKKQWWHCGVSQKYAKKPNLGQWMKY